MGDLPRTTFDLSSKHLHLGRDGAAETMEGGAAFWQSLMSGAVKLSGWLVTVSELIDDVDHWEMHPQGEELLVALSGALAVVLQEPAGERLVMMASREALVIPRGIWHRVVVREPGSLLFVTFGDGTEHKPLTPP